MHCSMITGSSWVCSGSTSATAALPPLPKDTCSPPGKTTGTLPSWLTGIRHLAHLRCLLVVFAASFRGTNFVLRGGAEAMATINQHHAKDGSTTYRVRIQRKGEKTQTATFPTLKDAKKWATMIEGQIIEGRHFPQKSTHTLGELIARYSADVQPHKAPTNQRREAFILRYWDQELGHRLLSDIQPVHIIECRDRLRKMR